MTPTKSLFISLCVLGCATAKKKEEPSQELVATFGLAHSSMVSPKNWLLHKDQEVDYNLKGQKVFGFTLDGSFAIGKVVKGAYMGYTKSSSEGFQNYCFAAVKKVKAEKELKKDHSITVEIKSKIEASKDAADKRKEGLENTGDLSITEKLSYKVKDFISVGISTTQKVEHDASITNFNPFSATQEVSVNLSYLRPVYSYWMPGGSLTYKPQESEWKEALGVGISFEKEEKEGFPLRKLSLDLGYDKDDFVATIKIKGECIPNDYRFFRKKTAPAFRQFLDKKHEVEVKLTNKATVSVEWSMAFNEYSKGVLNLNLGGGFEMGLHFELKFPLGE